MIRYFIILIGFCCCLDACAQQADSVQVPRWEDSGCDSTRRVDSLTIYDLVVPFRLTDSLRLLLKTPPKIFVVVSNEKGIRYWAGLAQKPGEKPHNLSLSGLNGEWLKTRVVLNWLDREILWSLVETPTYLYNRWENLLAQPRQRFLEKRDSLLHQYKRVFPQYELRISSDLRTASAQGLILKKGASTVPVSHHQLGLASDVAIIKRGAFVRDIKPYQQLGSLAASLGLTWGGSFVGFMDPPHVQLFFNSGELVRKYPNIRFEFEPYRNYYLSRVRKRIAEGKEKLILDTQQLLEALNDLRRTQPCACQKVDKSPLNSHLLASLHAIGYESSTDILIYGDLSAQHLTLVHPSNTTLRLQLGIWR